MEDVGDYDDIELEEMGERYPQYDDMDYHDLLTILDEVTGRMQREVKCGSDPLAISRINQELEYVKMRMEKHGTAKTSLNEGEDGTRKHHRTIWKHNRPRCRVCGGSSGSASRRTKRVR
jgi:hypothetical protein